MDTVMTEHVSLTVPDVAAAVDFYSRVFGWKKTGENHAWTEMSSGPFRLYLVADGGPSPMFAVTVKDVAAARDFAVENGCRIVGERDGETFLQDPYGHAFCLTGAS